MVDMEETFARAGRSKLRRHGRPPLDRPPRSVGFKEIKAGFRAPELSFRTDCDSFPGLTPSGLPSRSCSATVAGAAPELDRLPNSLTSSGTGQHLERPHMTIAHATSRHRLRHRHGGLTTLFGRTEISANVSVRCPGPMRRDRPSANWPAGSWPPSPAGRSARRCPRPRHCHRRRQRHA